MQSVEAKPASLSAAPVHPAAGYESFADSMTALQLGDASSPLIVSKASKGAPNEQEDGASDVAAGGICAAEDDNGPAMSAAVVGGKGSGNVKGAAVWTTAMKLRTGLAMEPVASTSKKAHVPALAAKCADHSAKGEFAAAAIVMADASPKVDVDVQRVKKAAVEVTAPAAAAVAKADSQGAVTSDKAMVDAAQRLDAPPAVHAAVDAKDAVGNVVAAVSAAAASAGTSERAVDCAVAKVEIVGGMSVTPLAAVAGPSAVASGHGGNAAGPVAHARREGEASELTLQSYDAATPNKLEVGVQGGAMGWLKVRAEYGQNGEVNTFLRGASVSTTAMLQAQAPGIATYLGTQDVVVKSVQVEAMRGAATSVAMDLGSGGAGGFQQQEKQRSKQSGYDGALQVSAGRGVDERMGGVDFLPVMYAMQTAGSLVGTGGWINVRA